MNFIKNGKKFWRSRLSSFKISLHYLVCAFLEFNIGETDLGSKKASMGWTPFYSLQVFQKKDIYSSLMLKPNNTDLKGPQVSKVPIKTITARLIWDGKRAAVLKGTNRWMESKCVAVRDKHCCDPCHYFSTDISPRLTMTRFYREQKKTMHQKPVFILDLILGK